MYLPKTETVSVGFNIPSPVQYEFQVLEMYDINDEKKIKKVTLQVRKNIYNTNGYIVENGLWTDVPRIRIPYDGR